LSPRPLTHRSAERKEVALDWRQPDDRPALRILHRLRVLGIPGFERRSGPKAGTDAAMREAWRLSWSIEQEAALRLEHLRRLGESFERLGRETAG
jgi:hypothetical protein